MDIAQVICDGKSQAVKLPDGYRFEGNAVSIRREGEAVILEPLKHREWPAGFFDQIFLDDAAFQRPNQGLLPPAPDFDSP
ncbi:MAG: AbrB/MazE/SpoVT family DNA-binding domain-containing protein [Planctomycetes bacterium]|nr:AbrB/MazE/SpoVT family DNA-binding domain-containing protein [Planctomycetota bacterium]